MKIPIPENESNRLDALKRYSILDTTPEESFDRITRIAAAYLGVPTVLVSLIDETRQWFKSRYGLDAQETPRDLAFCAYTIMSDEPMVVPDALLDTRFKENMLVTGAPHIRFYAGAPLHTHDGFNLGTLCAIDSKPRTLTDEQTAIFVDLANLVIEALEFRLSGEKALKEIASRKKIEGQLRASEERFRDIAESSSDWFWEMGPDLRFTYFTESFRYIAGIEPKALIGKTRRELVADREDTGKWKIHLADLENHRTFRSFKYEIQRPDGTTQHISVSGKPLFDVTGTFKGYRGTGTNITPQIEAERQAATAQELLVDAIESMPDMMALYDSQDRFVLCNKKYRETLNDIDDMLVPGMPLEEILRASVKRGLVKDVQDNGEEWIQTRLSRLRNPHDPVLHQQRNGRWVLTYDNKTKDGGTLIHRADVTELIQIQEKLRTAKEEADLASRTKSEFLANMSHELRTPLNAIIGFSDSIRHEIYGPLGNEKYKGYLEDIFRSGTYLLDLINDILDVSVIEAGKLELYEKELDIPRLMESVIRLVRPRAESSGVRLINNIQEPIPSLRADSRRVKQIFLNLLTNAIKFSPRGSTIILAATNDEDGALKIFVSDNGIGMSKEEIDLAMEPFGRANHAYIRNIEGTGLGLPLCNSLIKAHGGSLGIQSIPEKGTTVTVLFSPERVIRD